MKKYIVVGKKAVLKELARGLHYNVGYRIHPLELKAVLDDIKGYNAAVRQLAIIERGRAWN